MSDEMDLLPHQVIHLLGLGMEDRALRANSIWFCAGCYTCATRCPNDIDITAVMDGLRSKAVDQDIACPRPEVLAFHQGFLKDVRRRGRIHEMRMMGEYNLRRGTPFRDATVGVKMLLSGKLQVLPPRAVRGFKRWVKKLWKS